MVQENRKTGIRLNKYISETGVCSRREADRLIEQGKVTVDGKEPQMGQKVLEGQVVRVDGKVVQKESECIVLACNKPSGVVCTTADKENGKRVRNIISLIKYPKRVFPVGRLDKDSEGLILLTNQGEMMDALLRGANNHEKEYFVKVNRPLTEEFLKGMQEGVPILETVTKPCQITKINAFSFQIVLTQGLNRQIRRMCEYFGYRVVYLRRDRIVNIELGNIPKGGYRRLTDGEVVCLKKELAGGQNQ